MAKKLLLVLIIAAVAATGAFAQLSFSAGLGGYFTAASPAQVDFTGPSNPYAELGEPTIGGGAYVFFDATYAELLIGIGGHSPVNPDIDRTTTVLDLGLLLKLPISLGQKFILFPALGITYHIVQKMEASLGGLSVSVDDRDILKKGDWLSINLGVGTDLFFTDNIFLRGTLLLSAELPTEAMTDAAGSLDILTGVGVTFKLAVGYRF